MQTQLSFYQAQHDIILCEVGSGWTWSGTYTLFYEIETFSQTGQTPYHIIFDVRLMTGFSTRDFFTQARYLMNRLPPMFSGTLAVVGASDLIQTLVNSVRMLHPRLYQNTRVLFAANPEEACRLIRG